jgi:DNA adenine methylase
MESFLRWAGGKNWFVKHLHKYLPKNGFNDYHEPFLGGGSIFFSLQTKISYLSDLNEDLTKTYTEIRDNVEDVIKELKRFKNTEDFYYLIRDERKKPYATQEAAKFIFLNQTSFNGIFRVNLNGKYNVPYGFRTKDFFQPDNLRHASSALKNAKIFASDFTKILPI